PRGRRTKTERRPRASRPARLPARMRISRKRSRPRATRPRRPPTEPKIRQSTLRSTHACRDRQRDLETSGELRASQRLGFAEGHLASLGPGALEATPQLLSQPGDRVIQLDTVVRIRDRARLLEDALGARDETSPALEVAVVDRQHARIEKCVRPQIGVLVAEDPLARGAKAPLGLSTISAVQRDVHEVVVFACHIATLAETLIEIAALEIQRSSFLVAALHSRRRRSHVQRHEDRLGANVSGSDVSLLGIAAHSCEVASAQPDARHIGARVGQVALLIGAGKQIETLGESSLGGVEITLPKADRAEAFEHLDSIGALDRACAFEERPSLRHVATQPPETPQSRPPFGGSRWI